MLQAALTDVVQGLFSNTGPGGQRSMKAVAKSLDALTAEGVERQTLHRSRAYGQALALHILAWSGADGGGVVENMGFPMTYTLIADPGHWVPTIRVEQQQAPLAAPLGQQPQLRHA